MRTNPALLIFSIVRQFTDQHDFIDEIDRYARFELKQQ